MSILPSPLPVPVTADDLRALADGVESGEVRVIRHKNMLAVLRPEDGPLTIDDIKDALKVGAAERRAAERTLKRSPRR